MNDAKQLEEIAAMLKELPKEDFGKVKAFMIFLHFHGGGIKRLKEVNQSLQKPVKYYVRMIVSGFFFYFDAKCKGWI